MDEIASFFLVEDTFSTSRCLYDLVTLVTIEKRKKENFNSNFENKVKIIGQSSRRNTYFVCPRGFDLEYFFPFFREKANETRRNLANNWLRSLTNGNQS